MHYGDMTGVDFYLGNMERMAQEEKAFWDEVRRMKGGKRLAKMLRG
jgi:hypothetical protein